MTPPELRGPDLPLEVSPYRGVVPPGADDVRFVLADFYQATAALQSKYRTDGYILTRAIVPEQRIIDGAVQVRVLEGFINSVLVQGEIGPTRSVIETYLANLTEVRPVHARDLERYLLLVNDLPGISAAGILRAGTGEPGAAQLVVEVRRKFVDGFLTVSNRASRFTGPWAGAAGVAANGLLPYGDRLQFIYYSTFDRQEALVEADDGGFEQIFGVLSYEARVGNDGTKVLAEASLGFSRPGGSIAPLGIRSQVDRYGVGVSHPVIRSRQLNWTLGGRLDYIHEHVRVSNNLISDDQLTVLEIDSNLVFSDTLFSYAENEIYVTLNQGLPIFGASRQGDYYLTRPEGAAVFTTIGAEMSRLEDLSEHFRLFMAASAQFAFDTLLSQAEFRLGGDEIGRAYDPSELAGENGVGVLAELRYRGTTRFSLIPQYEAYAFWDYGKIWNTDNFGFDRDDSLSSAGVGARTAVYSDYFVDLEYARTLTRTLGTNDDDERKKNQFYLRLTAQF
jgi:hemolysin activation/secretion protein